MITVNSIIRITVSVAVASVSATLGGAVLGYSYEKLDVPATFPIHGLDEMASAIYLGLFGLVLGIVIGMTKLGLLSATIAGFALGVVFAVGWLSIVVSVPAQPDEVMVVGVILLLTAVGFLTGITSRALSIRNNRSV